ncbi:MAG: hypothetical protein JXR60_00090 [Bacteroidales bacterium]|nr:hypothetical protein [Bacteroidales bacterium]
MDIVLQHSDSIDKKRWDALLMQSPLASVFHNSWYLDVLDKDWWAFLSKDYTFVLPFFAEDKKVWMPFSVPYLGNVYLPEKMEFIDWSFIKLWQKHYTGITYTFGKFDKIEPEGKYWKKVSFPEIDLVNDFKMIEKHFSSEVQEIINTKSDYRAVSFRSLYEMVEFLKQTTNYTIDQINAVRRVVLNATQKKLGKMYALYDLRNQLCGVVFIIYYKQKAYILHSAFTTEALSDKADFIMLKTIIEDLSIYNLSLENHSDGFNSTVWDQFGFKWYYVFQYEQNTKQNLLSLFSQLLKR